MTVEEAYSALGVDQGVSATDARRAYMRQVKRHKPEVDPEGFQRARQAYELVKQDIATAEFLATYVNDDDCKNAAIVSQESAQTSAGPPTAPSSVGADVDDPLLSYREQADACETLQQEVPIWRRAVQAHPNEAEAWLMLLQRLIWSGNEADAGQVALEAYGAGHESFGEQLLQLKIRSAPAELLERARKERPLRSAAVAGYLLAGQPLKAYELALPLLHELESEQNPSEAQADLYRVFGLLGCLICDSHWAKAREVHARLQPWFAGTWGGQGIPEGHIVARWAIATELLQAGPDLQPNVSRGFAQLVLGKDNFDLRAALHAASREEKHEIQHMLGTLQRAAPELHRIASELKGEAFSDGKEKNWGWLWGVSMIVLFVLRGLGSAGSSHSSSVPTHQPERRMEVLQDLVERARERGVQLDLPVAADSNTNTAEPTQTPIDDSRLQGAQGVMQREGFEDAAAVVENMRLYFSVADCAALAEALKELDELTQGAPVLVRDEFQVVWGEILVACPDRRGGGSQQE